MLTPFPMFPKHRYPDLVTCKFLISTGYCAVMRPTEVT